MEINRRTDEFDGFSISSMQGEAGIYFTLPGEPGFESIETGIEFESREEAESAIEALKRHVDSAWPKR